jgi:hypothetical protein
MTVACFLSAGSDRVRLGGQVPQPGREGGVRVAPRVAQELDRVFDLGAFGGTPAEPGVSQEVILQWQQPVVIISLRPVRRTADRNPQAPHQA